jgi:peptide/nickel transport system substrate-binding protein
MAALGGAAVLLAACGSSSSSGSKPSSSGATTATTAKAAPQPAGTPQKGGTVNWAEAPAATPNYIFPMSPFADFSTYNFQVQQMLYRPLYWFGTGGEPTVDLKKSVGQNPVWSNNDKTVTVTLNHYVWSDGETVDARDVVLWMNMLKAEKKNWAAYSPGYFPDNVTSVTMPSGPTGTVVKFNLNASYNPTWFLYNELSQITPLPVAWDKTSAGGATPSATSTDLPDTTAAGAAKVYDYLTAAAKGLSTYASSPIWTVIDGPWKLSDFNANGNNTFVPNPLYVGPDKPYLSKFVEVPYTTDVAEFNTIKSSASTLQVGYVPAQDMPKLSSVESEGYTAYTFYPYAFNYMAINFTSSAVGALFKQLYIRQALQELIDQSGWIKAYFNGIAAPTYGPVPVLPKNPFSDAFENANPYPFSVASATTLLTSHGWTVKKGGTTTCADPTKCGAGIKAGQALSFKLDFASGSVPLTSSLADFKSVAAQAGVQLTTDQKAFDDVIGEALPTSKTWEIANWGGGWVYAPDYYASGELIYTTGAGSNSGAYSDPTADKLIKATTTVGASGSQSALDAYQNYIAKQLPVLFQPAPATENLVSKTLGGTVLKENAFTGLDPESWYYVKS